MSKRIVCTVTTDLVHDQRMIKVCTSLAEAGFEVLLIGREKAGSKRLSERVYAQERLVVRPEKGKMFYLRYHRILKRRLRELKPDIIYAVDLDTLPAGIEVAKRLHVRCVYDAHEYFSEVPELQGRPAVKKFWEWVARRYIPRADLCITVSSTLAKILSDRYKVPFHLVRNIPVVKELDASVPHVPKVILYQGALNKGRGLEYVIEAMQYLEGVVLWLAGTGDIESELRRSVQDLNLTHKVKFLGNLPPDELARVTRVSWLGINLIENIGKSYYYSLSNKFFDYMAAGIPSLNPAFPEYERILKDHPFGRVVEGLNPRELASAIEDLMRHPAKYDRMVIEAMKARDIFRWQEEGRKLVDWVAKL